MMVVTGLPVSPRAGRNPGAHPLPYTLILFLHFKFQWRSPIVYMALIEQKR
jgi:hypothetical protein